MDNASISVIIPAYNEEKFIKRCIQSLREQTILPDEIIVVDNNSTDNTVHIANQFPVKVIPEKKQGITYARNAGFDAAKYSILARCDADSYVPKNWIEEIKKQFSSRNIDAFTGTIVFYDLPLFTGFFLNLYTFVLKHLLAGNDVLMGPNMCVSKKIWNKIRNQVCMNNDKVHEDIDLTIHILQAKGIIYKDKKLKVESSSRRITKNPLSFFIEYPIRLYSTFRNHQ